MTEQTSNWNTSQGINWPVAIYLFGSPLATLAAVTAYAYFNGVHWLEPVQLLVLYYGFGLGLTAGYHRYFAHKSHEAHPIIQTFYLVTGATSIQRPVIDWASVHRIHHKYADTELDPHNIKQGFFYAHMGWILQKTAVAENYDGVQDLLNNKYVMWQKKYYWWLVAFGALLSTAIGATVGRPLGGLLWGFALRIILQNHSVYAINSYAHTFGKQTYSKRFEARDSFWLALISNGEGYHSFHHRFASDYRNGWKWFHWDPSKWFIGTMSSIGLTSNLRRTPRSQIENARLET